MTEAHAAAVAADDSATLSQACTALWTATLALMTAFMQTPAPAHRYLLARRIASNFGVLKEQECFTDSTRASFSRLAAHWAAMAEKLSPRQDKPNGGFGLARPAWLSGLF
jgi:hypothetical protein